MTLARHPRVARVDRGSLVRVRARVRVRVRVRVRCRLASTPISKPSPNPNPNPIPIPDPNQAAFELCDDDGTGEITQDQLSVAVDTHLF